jgi:tRNA (guanosine-2'-O-)-methyltransferase
MDKRGLVLGKRTSGGTFKWIDVYVFESLEECFKRVRQRYGRILATHLGEQSESLYDLDLTQPTALLFGNEDEGISAEALALADGNFTIPQAGFAESLNISVAAAVSLFEARRQRGAKGWYDAQPKLNPEQQEQLFQRWQAMLKQKTYERQQTTVVDEHSPELLPIFVQRDPAAPPKQQVRPAPLTKFDL